MKDTKSEARYGTPPNSAERCGLCAYYRIGVCTKVEGRISPTMWCKHFERRRDIMSEQSRLRFRSDPPPVFRRLSGVDDQARSPQAH
jgi:hypothetical protein